MISGLYVLSLLAMPIAQVQHSWEEMDAKAPKIPITAAQMDEMIRIYKGYGLPMPPKNAKIYRVHQHYSDSPNSHEMDGLAFVDESNSRKGRCVYWGSRRLTKDEAFHPRYSEEPKVEPVKLADPWVRMPRRYIGTADFGADYVPLWALTIQLSANGHRELAMKMHPNWFNEFSTRVLGWDPKWASPLGCVNTIALDFAREEWRRSDGDRVLAARIVDRVAKTGIAMEDVGQLKLEAEGMHLALLPGAGKVGTPEALIDALVDAPRSEGMSVIHANPVRKLIATGFDGIPALLAHRDDKRVTRILGGGIQMAVFNATVGFICREILRELSGNQTIDFEKLAESESAYCRDNVLPKKESNRRLQIPNQVLLMILAAKYPPLLKEITLDSLRVRKDVDPVLLIQAMRQAKLPMREVIDDLMAQVLASKGIETGSIFDRERFDATQALSSALIEAPDSEWEALRDVLPKMPPSCVATLVLEMRYGGPKRLEVYQAVVGSRLADERRITEPQLAALTTHLRGIFSLEQATVQNFAAFSLSQWLGLSENPTDKWTAGEWRALREKVQKKIGTFPDSNLE